MSDLERAVVMAGRVACGLGRGAPNDGVLVLAGLRRPGIELRRRLLLFWLRMATCGVDVRLIPRPDLTADASYIPSLRAILTRELQRFVANGAGPADICAFPPAIERRHSWPFAPWRARLPISVVIHPRELAADLLRRDRDSSPDSTIWLFTDGSVLKAGAGAAALMTRGSSDHYMTAGIHSSNLHSSTRMEIEAIRVGTQLGDIILTHGEDSDQFTTLNIVTDSQAAISGLVSGTNTFTSTCNTRRTLWGILESGCTISMMWVPGHQAVTENEAADHEAKLFGIRHHGAVATSLPHCAHVIKPKIE